MSSSQSLLHRADISAKMNETLDLKQRYEEILAAICKRTGFEPDDEKPHESTWWGKKVGAILVKGRLPQHGACVLKIEAVKLLPDEIDEVRMIQHAAKALEGSSLRPPYVFSHLPWTNECGGYAAVFLEHVQGVPVLSMPGTKEQIRQLIAIRHRYHQVFEKNEVTPWIALEGKREEYLSVKVKEKFGVWMNISEQLFSGVQERKESDRDLISKSVSFLVNKFWGVAPQFQQGHFSHRDVYQQGHEVILFSNLYWSYHAPFYDLLFAKHWYVLDLLTKEMSWEDIQVQREYWEELFSQYTSQLTAQEKRLFHLVQLERNTAALNLDVWSAQTQTNTSQITAMANFLREEITKAISVL